MNQWAVTDIGVVEAVGLRKFWGHYCQKDRNGRPFLVQGYVQTSL